MAEVASPAAPLGPVMTGAVSSTAVKSTESESLIALPLRVAVTEAVSTIFEEVKVAVYVPSSLSVVPDIVPFVEEITIVSPPEFILLPFTSCS